MKCHIRTVSGRKVHPLNPSPDEIDIGDIAHALSLNNRFCGHTEKPYSVAQHSVHVVALVEEGLLPYHDNNRLLLQALMHDASEAYMADIAAPLKRQDDFRLYREAEERLMHCIARRFGFDWPEHAVVKRADKAMLVTEARDLMFWAPEDFDDLPPPQRFRVRPWKPKKAKAIFLRMFNRLYHHHAS